MGIQQLQKLPLLSHLTIDQIQTGLKNHELILKEYDKEGVLHLQGDACDKIEIVIEGIVDTIRLDKKGNTFSITSFKYGDVIAAALIFSNAPTFPMVMVARTKVMLVEIKKAFVLEALKNNIFMFNYLQLVSSQATLLSNKIHLHIHRSIRDNLLLFLKIESQRVQSKQIKLSISKTQLANDLGIQRTSLSRELKKMQDDGLIRFNKDVITLL